MSKIISALVVFLMMGVSMQAQITSGTASMTELTPYTSETLDMIHYFDNASSISLSVNSSQTAEFTWRKLNQVSKTWEFVSSSIGMSSDISNIDEGCFEVGINTGSSSVSYRAWALVPEMTGNVTMEVVDHTCAQLTVKTNGVTTKPLTIVAPNTGKAFSIQYDIVYQWMANNLPIGIAQANTQTNLAAPYTDADYFVEASCRFTFLGKQTSLPVNVVAKAVKAFFNHKIDKPEHDNEDHSDTQGSAPLRVEFTAKPEDSTDPTKMSEGKISAYTYDFGGVGKDFVPNTAYVFQVQDTYAVTLTVENQSAACVATYGPVSFLVTDLMLDAPNFFTPTGDGIHDEFRVSYRSVRDFRMTIVNRWGRVVYESTNPAEGWDGKIGGKEASPGVYFYDAVATGYAKGESKHIKGFLHLLRRGK